MTFRANELCNISLLMVEVGSGNSVDIASGFVYMYFYSFR